MVVSEVALALALVTTAGLMVKSLMRLQSQDLGITREPMLTFGVGVPQFVANGNDAVRRFQLAFLEKVRALPGVTHASGISMLPIAFTGNISVQLLPARHPRQPKEDTRTYDWRDDRAIGRDILALSTPVTVNYVSSEEGGDTAHGFKLAGPHNIDVEIPKRGRGDRRVVFTPSEVGTYTFECSRICGAGHGFMRGTIHVKARTGTKGQP